MVRMFGSECLRNKLFWNTLQPMNESGLKWHEQGMQSTDFLLVRYIPDTVRTVSNVTQRSP